MKGWIIAISNAPFPDRLRRCQLNEANGITDSGKTVCGSIGNFDVKFLFDLHDDLNDLKRIGIQIFGKISCIGYFIISYSELLADDFCHPVSYLGYCGICRDRKTHHLDSDFLFSVPMPSDIHR
ncbi:hypothetical protein AGR7B_Lc50351 [Agrobacterium deltaense RV3]|nr:hypothetical protein AGR7B_Lc50351 [Agrobacterium deltaense RV3]